MKITCSPRVSVVMPTYNRHSFLLDSVRSILRQTMPDFELIIVNDGSSDEKALETLSSVESIDDDRIKIIHQNNQGPAAARNAGILCSSAPLVALMDDDDISSADRLDIQTKFMDQNLHAVAVTTLMGYMDQQGKITPHSRDEHCPYFSPRPFDLESSLEILQRVCLTATSMVRRPELVLSGAYRPWFKQTEDIDLTLRIIQNHTIALISDRVYIQRRYRSQSRVSLGGSPWDYLAAAVLSLNCRLEGSPDPIPQITVGNLLAKLGSLPGSARRYLIWGARGTLRRYIRDGSKAQFYDLWDKLYSMVKDYHDTQIFDRVKKRVYFWLARHLRLWRI